MMTTSGLRALKYTKICLILVCLIITGHVYLKLYRLIPHHRNSTPGDTNVWNSSYIHHLLNLNENSPVVDTHAMRDKVKEISDSVSEVLHIAIPTSDKGNELTAARNPGNGMSHIGGKTHDSETEKLDNDMTVNWAIDGVGDIANEQSEVNRDGYIIGGEDVNKDRPIGIDNELGEIASQTLQRESKKGYTGESNDRDGDMGDIYTYRNYFINVTITENKDIMRIIYNDPDVSKRLSRLWNLFKPALKTNVPLHNDFLKQFYAIVAVIRKFVLNNTEPVYVRKVIDIENVGHDNSQKDSQYVIDCSNIRRIHILGIAGKGAYKHVYKGEYFGKEVAVKVSRPYLYLSLQHRCHSYVRTNSDMLKEIFFQKFVSHPMISKPLGYCIHHGMNISGVYIRPGLTVVYVYGRRVGNLFTTTPWIRRLEYAIHVADFLRYCKNTTLGHIYLGDFKSKQIYMEEGRIALSDTHMCRALHYCGLNETDSRSVFTNDSVIKPDECRHNLISANKIFFRKLLLPKDYPQNIGYMLSDIQNRIDNFTIGPSDLYYTLRTLKDSPAVTGYHVV